MISDRLKTEFETYELQKGHLIAIAEGKFVVISGQDILGFWDTYEDALSEAYARCGRCKPFAVKQINAIEQVHFIAREFAC